MPVGTLNLTWNPSPDPSVAGYNIYYGTQSRVYANVVAVENTQVATITGLTPGVPYFLTVVSRSIDGVESPYSGEISFTLPSTAPVLRATVTLSGGVNLTAAAPPSHSYDVLATEDFSLWRAIGTATADASGSISFNDPDVSQYPSRFYLLHETTYTAAGSLPVLDGITVTDAGVQLRITGQAGHSYEILTSPDFQVWRVVGTVTVSLGGTATALLPANPGSGVSYYRLRETSFASAQAVTPFKDWLLSIRSLPAPAQSLP